MPLSAVLLLAILCNFACHVSSGNPALKSGSTAHLSPDDIMDRCKETFGSNVTSNVAIPRTWSAAQKQWKSIVIHATWAYLNALSKAPARIPELKADHGSFDFWVESVSGRPTSSLIELRAIVYMTSFNYGADEGMSGITIAHFYGFYHGPSASLCMVGCKQDTMQLSDFANELDTAEGDNAVGVAAGATKGGKSRRLMEGGGESEARARGGKWRRSSLSGNLADIYREATSKVGDFSRAVVGSSGSSSSSSSSRNSRGVEGGRATDEAAAEWRSSLREDVEGARRMLQGAGSDEREEEDLAELMRAQEGEGEGGGAAGGGGGSTGRVQPPPSSSSAAQSPNAATIKDMERQWAAQEGAHDCSFLLQLSFSNEFSWEKQVGGARAPHWGERTGVHGRGVAGERARKHVQLYHIDMSHVTVH